MFQINEFHNKLCVDRLGFVMDLYFTFDSEDFINTISMKALSRVLELLSSYDLKAIFFFNGQYVLKN